jgi:hypothetical protein
MDLRQVTILDRVSTARVPDASSDNPPHQRSRSPGIDQVECNVTCLPKGHVVSSTIGSSATDVGLESNTSGEVY